MDWTRHASYLVPDEAGIDWIETVDISLAVRELSSGDRIVMSDSAMHPGAARRVERTISDHITGTHYEE